jgi:hypothetical protein
MDFWAVHGVWFLIGMIALPRLTMLIATTTPFGPLAWVGWLIWPNLLAAILATTFYWHTNPILCVCAWLLMVGKAGGAANKANT